MYPAATLFLDVCVQQELWPDGAWPLVRPEQAANVERLFALARTWPVRQGGVICRHTGDGTPPLADVPEHCRDDRTWAERPPTCRPALPIHVEGAAGTADREQLDRGFAVYVDSGCAARPDAGIAHGRAFAHLAAGVRDAVVFGAGIEHAMARAVDALLARRIRVHVVLDASGAADEVAAQPVVAIWKRWGVDVTTVAMIERMFLRN